MIGFLECNIQHVNRLGNEATHRLTINAWNVDHIVMWCGDVPNFLSQAVWLDKNNM